jgi:hypothetical protein
MLRLAKHQHNTVSTNPDSYTSPLFLKKYIVILFLEKLHIAHHHVVPSTTYFPHYHFYQTISQITHPPNMPPTQQTPKHKRQRDKFWAFVLLAANHMLNHDFLPPWGLEFLLRVNAQGWWYTYSHCSEHEPENQGEQQEHSESLSDEASVGDVSNHYDYQDEQQKPGLADYERGNEVESTYSGDDLEQSEAVSLLPRFEWEKEDSAR